VLSIVRAESHVLIDRINCAVWFSYLYDGRIISPTDEFVYHMGELARMCCYDEDEKQFEHYTPIKRDWETVIDPHTTGTKRIQTNNKLFYKLLRFYRYVQSGKYKDVTQSQHSANVAKVRICQAINGHA
jgi:hypothetical protein